LFRELVNVSVAHFRFHAEWCVATSNVQMAT